MVNVKTLDYYNRFLLDCKSLKLGDKLQHIDNYNFKYSDLEEIDLSECDQLNLGSYPFAYSKNLKKIIFPDNCIKLREGWMKFCPRLEEVVAVGAQDIEPGTFEKCPNLHFLQLAPNFDEGIIEKELKSSQHNLEKRLARIGVILKKDYRYSYIWCFNNNKLYYTESVNHTLHSIVWFKHGNQRKQSRYKDGFCITSTYDDYHAEEVCEYKSRGFEPRQIMPRINTNVPKEMTDEDRKKMRVKMAECIRSCLKNHAKNRYEETWEIDPVGRIGQKGMESIDFYLAMQRHDLEDSDKSIQNICTAVDALNIEEIIESYHTEFYSSVHYGSPGKDDVEYYSVTTKGIYTDAYLETLLPTNSDSGKSVGYSGYTGFPQWKIDEQNRKDQGNKSQARLLYKKEAHKQFLIDVYRKQRNEDIENIERRLHIHYAENILKASVSFKGKDMVLFYNTRYFQHEDELKYSK